MRFDLPEDKKLTYEMVIPIRWGDMDAMGHVNNTIYFRYLEIIRIEWLHKAGGAPITDFSKPVADAIIEPGSGDFGLIVYEMGVVHASMLKASAVTGESVTHRVRTSTR